MKIQSQARFPKAHDHPTTGCSEAGHRRRCPGICKRALYDTGKEVRVRSEGIQKCNAKEAEIGALAYTSPPALRCGRTSATAEICG